MKKCLQCGVELEDDIKFCPECGFDLSLELFCPICKTPFKANQKKCNKCLTPLPKVNKKLPKELQKFNFSAFFLTFIWGAGHNCFWPLIILIPVVGILAAIPIAIYLGINGNRIAWNNYIGNDIEDFKKQEKPWAIACWTLFSIILILCSFLFVAIFIPNSKKMQNIIQAYNKQDFDALCSPVLNNRQDCVEQYKQVYRQVGELSKIRVHSVNVENKRGYEITSICAIAKSAQEKRGCDICIKMTKIDKDKQVLTNFDVNF